MTLQIDFDISALVDPWIPEMTRITAASLLHLLDYRARCAETASKAADMSQSTWWGLVQTLFPSHNNCKCPNHVIAGSTSQVKRWVVESIGELRIQLKEKPCSEVVLTCFPRSYRRKAVGCPMYYSEIDKKMSPLMDLLCGYVDAAVNTASDFTLLCLIIGLHRKSM